MVSPIDEQAWNIEQACEIYKIREWSDGYFDINDYGHLSATLRHQPKAMDLYELTRTIQEQGLSLPVLVRFTDIIHDRVHRINQAFSSVRQEYGYDAAYYAMYPIKANQQRHVVEDILSSGQNVGLEVGSKPELIAALALSHANGRIVCNGHKDGEYIRLALLGSKLRLHIYIVIESTVELDILLEQVRIQGIKPQVGIRIRLSSVTAGKWGHTSGYRSKFGLTATQLLTVVDKLRQADSLDWLEMLHFHMGSQVADIDDIRQALVEVVRYFSELHRIGVNIRCVDVGGGLSIDYDGSASSDTFSCNYQVEDYAREVVRALACVCRDTKLPHPEIVTEAGRGLVAHHAVLITNALNVEPAHATSSPEAPTENAPQVLHQLLALLRETDAQSAAKAYKDASRCQSQARLMFENNKLDLAGRAAADELYYAICRHLASLFPSDRQDCVDILAEINEKIADKYFFNFSLFQSLPDSWALQQVFPIVPLHHLDKAPSRCGVLQDISCDSDGRIERYVTSPTISSSLPLHPIAPGQEYLIGIFLVGAYQEILGNLHNLFGDTDSVHVVSSGNGEYRLLHPQQGDNVCDVLGYLNYDSSDLLRRLRERLPDTSADDTLFDELELSLGKYTYMQDCR